MLYQSRKWIFSALLLVTAATAVADLPPGVRLQVPKASGEPYQLFLTFGQTEMEADGWYGRRLERGVGGERIEIEFRHPTRMQGIILSGASRDGRGGVLLRHVESIANLNDGTVRVLSELFNSAANPQGVFTIHERTGTVFLNNQDFVQATYGGSERGALSPLTVQRLTVRAEGYRQDDATLAVQFFSDTPVELADITVYRTPSPEETPRPTPPPGDGRGSYFNWGRAYDGYGDCYEYTHRGEVLNGGQSVWEGHCESVSPSVYRWGRGYDGYTYCYRYSRSGLMLSQGRTYPNSYCR